MPRVDLTVLAIPAFAGAMAAEYAWYRRNPAPAGMPRAGDYELADTIASLTMGLGSLLAPLVTRPLLDRLRPGRGRAGKALLVTAVAGVAARTAADLLARRLRDGDLPEAGTVPTASTSQAAPVAYRTESGPRPTWWRRLGAGGAVAAVGSTVLSAATTWTTITAGKRIFARNRLDLGSGSLATIVAILGWDAIYYWNHRLSHESRWLWAVHVVHHSSERYNLSTALRQPVAEGFTMAVPYGLLCLLGVRPSVVENARALNLIYQFWIHTEAVRSIGWLEKVFNTPSHHRVHHGSNRRYLDRNHGSILIVWDKIFGTFEPEGERPVYGLTRSIDTYNPAVIATHEWQDMAKDVADAPTWQDRFGFVVRGPGWAYRRRDELAAGL